ncbi:hypothetical protein BDV23DRAFT_167155 [Aspergillus alliaceus]|uniref:Aminoglycoside phosphotransferase domain-containing protein n=1 Tax=Petromyces alliaceus TaxID=209559 RepID=A0A5N7BR20_PETAA|nr:hypothetical protein BDV23DRAFT_167155 [Aspergillus alliaceus]
MRWKTGSTLSLIYVRNIIKPPPDIPPFRFTNVLTHQDISPRNLIWDRGGLVWLVD